MRNLKKNLQNYYNFLLIIPASIILIVSVFFWKTIIKEQIPIPGDFVVGVYYPWLDYKWGYIAGVPVKNPITTDVPSFIYPMQTLAMELLKNNERPLWNRLILSGTPLLANFQSAPYSPTNFVYFIYDKVNAWGIQIILQHIIALSGTYLLLRRYGSTRLSSLIGGTVYSFAGYNIIWSQWNGHTLAASFIPFLILCVDSFMNNKSIIAAACISIYLALQIYSGYPQSVLYTLLAIGILWLIKIIKTENKINKTILLVFSMILALGLSAVQILPGAELLKYSQRELEPHPYEWAFLPYSKIITFVAPDYYGNHATKNYWGPQDYTSNTGYVGTAALTLACVAIFYSKNKNKKYAITLSFISLALALPTFISITIWRSGFLGMQAASAHRSLILWNLGIALLAAFGADVILKQKISTIKSIFLPALILIGFFLFSVVNLKENRLYEIGIRNLIFPLFIGLTISALIFISNRLNKYKITILLLLLILASWESFRFGWKFTPFSNKQLVFPTTPVLEFLQNKQKPFRVTGSHVIPINMRMPYGLESLEGYDAVYPLNIAKFIASINGQAIKTTPQGRYATVDNDTSHLLDLVNTKYYLTLKLDERGNPNINGNISTRFSENRFIKAFEDKTTVVLESKTAMPRAFMVYDWEVLNNEDELLGKLLNPNFDFKTKLLLAKKPQLTPNTSKFPYEVNYTSYKSNESRLDVKSFADGMLFISDTYFPGWKAYVNGKEQEILNANYAFMAIEVEKGTHSVDILYEPDSFEIGKTITNISFFILLIELLLWYTVAKR